MDPVPFLPPAPCPAKLADACRYLSESRKLPVGYVQSLAEQGRFYATADNFCVFPTSTLAEMRSFATGDKRLSQGSRRKEFWNAGTEGPSDTLCIAESAIDAMSIASLLPHAKSLSTSGSSFSAICEILAQNPEKTVLLCYDADSSGDFCCARAWAGALLHCHLGNRALPGLDPAARIRFFADAISDFCLDGPLEPGGSDFFPAYPDQVSGQASYGVYFPLSRLESGLAELARPDGFLPIPADAIRQAGSTYKIRRMPPPYGKDWNDSLEILRETQELQKAAAPANSTPRPKAGL